MSKNILLVAVLAASLASPAVAADISLEGVATKDIKATIVAGRFKWFSKINPWSKSGTACVLKKDSTYRFLKLRRALWAEVVVTFVPHGDATDACGRGKHVSISLVDSKAGIAARAAKKD